MINKACCNCAYMEQGMDTPPCDRCQGSKTNYSEWRKAHPFFANTPAEKEPIGNTGFVRDVHAGKGRMDLLPWIGIMEVSKLCEEGALHYGERNIDKGAPLHSLLDSGARHLAKLMSGYTDEDHLRSACWNLLWALQERTTHPELNDTPWPWYGEKNEK